MILLKRGVSFICKVCGSVDSKENLNVFELTYHRSEWSIGFCETDVNMKNPFIWFQVVLSGSEDIILGFKLNAKGDTHEAKNFHLLFDS